MAVVEEPARRTPVVAEAEVVVLGGGPAGIAAATAEIVQVVHGVADDLLERIARLDGLKQPHSVLGRAAAQAYDVAAYKCAADDRATGPRPGQIPQFCSILPQARAMMAPAGVTKAKPKSCLVPNEARK